MYLFSSLLTFDYARFVWASRSMLAAIIALLFSYAFPNIGPWLILSAVMTLQLYLYGERSLSKATILLWSVCVALTGATLAIFSGTLWILWTMVISLISVTFYVSYQGSDRASMGLWSAILVLINVFFPINGGEWIERISLLLIGIVIAYLMLFIKVPRRKKDRITTQLHDFLTVFQNYITSIFHNLLFEKQEDQNSHQHDEAREALAQLQNSSEVLRLTYNINLPTIKTLLVACSNSYNHIFHWLVAIEQLQKIILPADTKLCLEHLHTTFQSFSNSFFEDTSDHQKIVATLNYWLDKMKDASKEIQMTIPQRMNVSELYYLLKKLAYELEILATFLDSPSAKKSIAYLQQTGV